MTSYSLVAIAVSSESETVSSESEEVSSESEDDSSESEDEPAYEAAGDFGTDFCNFDLGNKLRTEEHPALPDGRRVVVKDYNCAPWNKEGGRDKNTCLLMKDYPTGAPYVNICAEATPDSTYFTPRIRIRGQQCNFLACWTTNDVLDWDGECVTLAGEAILPLHRMCARVAMPEVLQKGEKGDYGFVAHVAADPGYTNGKHLDTMGITQEDEKKLGMDGQEIIVEAPKLCAYSDPAFIGKDGDEYVTDFMDLDPISQPMHLTTDTHPVIEVIIFLFDFVIDGADSISDLISSLTDDLFGEDDSFLGDVIKDLLEFLGDLISSLGDWIIEELRTFGQINRAVDDKSYGCVNLPLGPMPPPFCEKVAPLFQLAEVQDICPIDADTGVAVESLANKLCHVSTVRNNYVRNSVRVGYEDLVPLCKEDQKLKTTDKCINIKNLDLFSSAKSLHAITSRRDIIRHCVPDDDSSEPCVESNLPHSCSVEKDGCENGYRVVYGRNINMSGRIVPQSYYRDDLPDCTSQGSVTCQQIWGINRGEFQDVSVVFPKEQTPFEIGPVFPKSSSFWLHDKGGQSSEFVASIVREATYNPDAEFTQDPKEICVIEGNNIVAGCRKRVQISQPTIYKCEDSPNPEVTCESSYYSPRFIISYKDGEDSTTAVIEPKALSSTPKEIRDIYSQANISSLINIVNLAGNKFESFVTDDSFSVKPFSGEGALNPITLFGKYQDGTKFIEKDKKDNLKININALYLSGLEYINGYYRSGGKYACLESHGYTKCPHNPKMCVKSNLLNRDEVSCSTFFDKSAQYGGLNICSNIPSSNICTTLDKIPKKNGGGSIEIRDCGKMGRCYASSKELCQVSYALEDRVDPAIEKNELENDELKDYKLKDGMYFDVEAKKIEVNNRHENVIKDKDYYKLKYPDGPETYDRDLYGLRDKTPIELGLCIEIPKGTCAAEDGYSEDTGFASWPSVELGEDSIGTCQQGKEPKDPDTELKRRCVADPNNQSFRLEPLYRKETNKPKTYPTNIKCVTP